mgnify:CR=1 FL=1
MDFDVSQVNIDFEALKASTEKLLRMPYSARQFRAVVEKAMEQAKLDKAAEEQRIAEDTAIETSEDIPEQEAPETDAELQEMNGDLLKLNEEFVAEIEKLTAQVENYRSEAEKAQSTLAKERTDWHRQKKSYEGELWRLQKDNDELRALLESCDEQGEAEQETYEEGEAALPTVLPSLPESRIVFVGGHPNMVNKVKAIYPNWVYVDGDHSPEKTTQFDKVIACFIAYKHIGHPLWASMMAAATYPVGCGATGNNCTALTSLNVSGWNTSNVTNMNTVFHNCSALTSLDLTGWSAAKVTEMNYMFVDCKLLQEVTLDKDFVFVGVDGYLPFPSPTYITGATGKWYDTTSGTGYTPAELAAVTRTGTVTYTAVLPTPVMKSTSSWANGLADKTSVTKITLLDKYTVTGAETASWDASENNDGSVKCYVVGEELIISGNGKGTIKASVDATGMFMGFTNVTEISNLPLLDTSDTKKMSSFFSGCSHLRKLDLSGMNTRKACDSDNRNVYVDYFFHGCTRLETLILGSDVYFGKSYGGIANDFIPAPSPFFVESASGYFYNTSTGESVSNNSLLYWSSNTTVTLSAKPLTAPTGNPVLRTENGSWFRLSGGKNHTIENSKITKITFVNKYTPSAVDYADYEVWDASANNDMSTFCVRIGTEIIIAGNGTGKIKAQASCGGMFYGSYSSKLGFSGLKEVAGLSVLDTSDVTYMGDMFGECSALTRVDVSSFNMSKVTGLSQMFYRCSSLTSVDCSGWDVSKVTATSYMFSGCTNLRSINLSGWNPVSLGSMAGMFYNCSNVESLDLSKFSTDKITNVYSMRSIFDGMNNLRTVTLGPSFNKFKFYSYGQYVTCYLPAPSATYISGADGKWYDTNTRVGYTPDQFDGMTRSAAVTYVAVMDPSPYMASGSSWWRYSDSNMKGYVNAIEFATSYTPSGTVTAQWSGDEDNRGVYKCYLVPTSGTINYNGTTKTAQKLIIASSNGGKIKLNADSDSFLGTGYWGNVKTLTGLSNLDTSAVTQMGSFFGTMTGYTNALDLRSWNVSNVTNMDTMFYNVSASSINIRGWNVSNLRSAFAMFGQCKNVKTIYLGNFNVPSSCDLTYMFNSTNTGTYGRTGPTVYVASASIKSTIVNLAGLTENTSSNWNSDLNPSQIVVNATAGQSATSQVMALVFGDNEDIVGYNVTNGETVEVFAEVG